MAEPGGLKWREGRAGLAGGPAGATAQGWEGAQKERLRFLWGGGDQQEWEGWAGWASKVKPGGQGGPSGLCDSRFRALVGTRTEAGRVTRARTVTTVPSADTCYVLSFSIIMLNTSLHNPSIWDKPPFERFVSMNRGINNGSDLLEDQLRVRGTAHPAQPGHPGGSVLRRMAAEGLL